jgi:hypothetical protein
MPATAVLPGGGVRLPALPLTAAGGRIAGVPAVREGDPATASTPIVPALPLTAAGGCAIAPPTPIAPHAGGQALVTWCVFVLLPPPPHAAAALAIIAKNQPRNRIDRPVASNTQRA